jgi:hypothetical protein
MSVITPRVVNYAAQECFWQQSGEMSVAWMVEGWRYAHRYRFKPIKLRDVLELGRVLRVRALTHASSTSLFPTPSTA